MHGSKSEKTGSSSGIWAFALLASCLVAGGAFWMKSGSVEAPTAPVVAAVQGSSFDAPAPVPLVAESRAPEKPADAAVPKSVPEAAPIPPAAAVATVEKVAEKPVEPTAEKTVTAAVPDPVPVEPAESKAVEKPAPTDEKPLALSFAKLFFRYWPQIKGGKNPFPPEVLALDGKKVTIDGYMIPIDFEKGKVRSFLLSRGMMGCCYADSPQITEMIKVVRADGKMVPFEAMARVTGVLEVGEEKDSEGYVESVYRIKADVVGAAPLGKW